MANVPSPPFVSVPGISNFRDIGQQTTENGKKVRSGLIYRSADPSKATEEGLNTMSKTLGLKTIYDLRSAPEIKRDGPEWANVEVASADVFSPYGIHRSWVPVFAEQDYGPEQVAVRYREYTSGGSQGFVNAYRDILKAGSGPEGAYTTILRGLAKKDVKPCLVHCTAGKDRTGVLVALLLMLVDVPTEAIAEEYALTDLGLAELKPVFMERLLKNPALEGNADGVQRMVSSKRESMVASVEMIGKEFGGSEGYMREWCGLGEGEVEGIRENLLGI